MQLSFGAFTVIGPATKIKVEAASKAPDLQTSGQTNSIQTNISLTEACSGGPLLNSYGEVVGINLWRTENGQSTSHTVSIKDLYKINTNGTQNIGEHYMYYEWEQFSRIVKDDQPNGHGISTSVQQKPRLLPKLLQ